MALKTCSDICSDSVQFQMKQKIAFVGRVPQTTQNLVISRSRPRPHYAGGIWKRSFISLVRPSVHTNLEKFSAENGAFRKRSWKRRNLKTELCVLLHVDWKHFENCAFRNRWRHNNQMICLPESSSNTNPKWLPKWFKRWRKQRST